MRLQIVRFTVTKTDMSQKIPYIQGNLLSNSVDEGKMANQNMLFDNRVADLAPEEFDRVQQTSEDENSGIGNTKKKRKRDVAFSNDVTTPPKKKKKKTDVEQESSDVSLESSSLKKKKKKKMKMETGESATTDDEDLTERMLEAIKNMEGLRQDKEEAKASKGKKKKKKIKGKAEVNSELVTSVSLHKEKERANKSPDTSKGTGKVANTNVKKDKTSKKPRKVPPYALFIQENRKKLRSEHPDMGFAEIAKKMGEMWRSLSSEEKETYIVKAKFVNEEKFQKWKNLGVPESKSSKKKGEHISAEVRDQAYCIFVEQTRPNLIKLYPSLNVTDTNRMIDDLWKSNPMERKDEYKKRVEVANKVEVRNTLNMAKPLTEVAKKKPGKTSSYMMFFQEKRPIIIERFPSKTFTEISKIAGHLWKELTEVEKDEYKRKADVFNGEKLQRWAMENSSNQGSPVAKKAATPRKQKGEDSTGTSSGNMSRLARQSQGWSFQPQFILCHSSMFLLKDMANFQNFKNSGWTNLALTLHLVIVLQYELKVNFYFLWSLFIRP